MNKRGFFQASMIAGYILAVSLFMSNIENVFKGVSEIFAPIIMLLLLSGSVLFCGLAVFYKPYILFFDKKKKQAVDLVVKTTMWLFCYFILAFLLAVAL